MNYSEHDHSVLKAHYYEFMPYFKMANDTSNVEGICGVVINYIMKSMNIRYEVIPSNIIPTLGSKQKDGSWDGVVGLIHKNDTQFSFLPIIPTPNDLEIAELTFPFWFTSFAILSGLHSGFKREVFNFFDETTEICLAVCFIILTLMSFSMERKIIQVFPTTRHKTRPVSFQKHCTLFLRPIFYQAVSNINIIPVSSAAKLCFIMWWMTMIVMFNLISSQLTAASSSLTKPFRFDSLEDILQFPNTRIIIIKDPNVYKYFQTSPYTVEQDIYRQVLRHNGLVEKLQDFYSEMNLRDTRLGRSVIIADKTSISEKIKEECPKNYTYIMSKGTFNPIQLSLIFAKSLGTSFLNDVNTRIIRFFETGNAALYLYRLQIPLINCIGRSKAQKSADTILKFKDARVFLFFYSFGVAAALIIFIAEICTKLVLSSKDEGKHHVKQMYRTKRRKKLYVHFPKSCNKFGC